MTTVPSLKKTGTKTSIITLQNAGYSVAEGVIFSSVQENVWGMSSLAAMMKV